MKTSKLTLCCALLCALVLLSLSLPISAGIVLISGDDGDGLIDKNDPDCFICGDEILDPIEQCDDGNIVSDDGCDQFCQLEGPIDSDFDGVTDDLDVCSDTVIPEAVPTQYLGVNRWALVDSDGVYDTTLPLGGGRGPGLEFTIEDTAGCSCEQIILALSLGQGHEKHGCSISAMEDYVEIVNP